MTRHLQSSPVCELILTYPSIQCLRVTVEDVYQPDRVKEAIQVFGADDPAHPAVAYLRNNVKDYYVGGKIQAIQPPTHFDYVALRCKLIYY